MDTKGAQAILDKVIGQITGYRNPLSLEQFRQKYAFDVNLPAQVTDATTGEQTWSQSVNAVKFMSWQNAVKRMAVDDWQIPKRPLNSIDDILSAWSEINYVTTERQIESIHVVQSDNIYGSEYVLHSQDVTRSKNILYCDGTTDCEFVIASQRSNRSNYCVRLEDSQNCSNSFSVSWSGGIVNSLFIHGSGDLFECMFCSNIKGKKFCIANMQFEEAEYRKLKDMVVRWMLAG